MSATTPKAQSQVRLIPDAQKPLKQIKIVISEIIQIAVRAQRTPQKRK